MTDQTQNLDSTETNAAAEDTQAPNIVTEGSVRHNKELVADLARVKARLKAFEDADETAKADKLKEQGKFDELLLAEQNKFNTELSARETRINELLTNNALNDLIGSYDVKPTLRSALISHLKGKLSINDGEVSVSGKTPDEFAKAFFATEEGRDFLKPVMNSGGGATGNTSSAPATPEVWNLTTYTNMKAEDPVLAAAYAKKHNKYQ